MDKSKFFEQLRVFLAQTNEAVDPGSVTPDQNLFNTGVLDSFRVVELITFIEEVRGQPLQLEQTTLDSVSTMENIHATFFGG